MKKLLVIFALISLTFVGCDSFSKKESVSLDNAGITKTVSKTDCDTLRITTSPRIAKVLEEIISEKQAYDGTNFVVEITPRENYTIPYRGKEIPGFTINGTDVGFSDSIVSKAEAMLGANSDIPKADLGKSLDRFFCKSQYADFMHEYSKVKNSCVTTVTNTCPPVVSKVETSWWSNVPLWAWIIPILLLLFLLWLIGDRNKTHDRTETSSKTTSVSDDKFKYGADMVVKMVNDGHEAEFDHEANGERSILRGRPGNKK